MIDQLPDKDLEQPESTGSESSSSPAHTPELLVLSPDDIVEPIPHAAIQHWRPFIFVWIIWLSALLLALMFVAQYGHSVPWRDDFEMIPYMTGDKAVTASWLWRQHNEHRIPLPRLILLALGKASICDFRAGMYFNVLALGGLAFAMIRAATQVRGWVSYTDAIFPLALLHLGHYENILWCFQVGFVVPTVLAGTLLVIMANKSPPFKTGPAILAGCCLLLLPLCGAPGLAFVPAAACWLGYCGVRTFWDREGQGKTNGILMIALSTLSLLLVGLYFVGYQNPARYTTNPGPWATVQSSLTVLSMSCGPVAVGLAPYLALGMFGLMLLSGGVLIRAWLKHAQKRCQTLGFLLFMASLVILALGIAWKRGSTENTGFAPRYATLLVLLLCCLYYVSEVCVYSGRELFKMLLFVIICAVYIANMQKGYSFASERHTKLSAFERDMTSGTPSQILAQRYNRLLNPRRSAEYVEEYLHMLYKADVSPYNHMHFARTPNAYFGRHDKADCQAISGWAWDKERPNTPVDVDIYDGNRIVATVRADRFRPGLQKSGYGDGKHGFNFPVPKALKDGRTHVISVKIAGTRIDLKGTPKSITCIEE